MPDSVNPETCAKIDELCKKIAIAHDLNPEIQAELSGHMEDKLLGYVSGQEPLSEDDAFILVREHFGSPAKIKTLLQDVHYVASDLSLARRLCPIVALYLAYLSVMGFCLPIAWGLSVFIPSAAGISGFQVTLYNVVATVLVAVWTYAYWRVLRSWHRQLQTGPQPWFQRWRGSRIVILLSVLMCAQLAIPTHVFGVDANAVGPLRESTFITILSGIVITGCFLTQAIIWLWWSDSTPRRPRTLTIAALVWLILTVFPWHIVRIVVLTTYSYEPSIIVADIPGELISWRAPDGGYSGLAIRIRPIGDAPQISLGPAFVTFVIAVFAIALAKFLYLRLDRVRTIVSKWHSSINA